jgi:hypothetical protein
VLWSRARQGRCGRDKGAVVLGRAGREGRAPMAWIADAKQMRFSEIFRFDRVFVNLFTEKSLIQK